MSDSSLHKHMTELRAAGERNVSLAEIADIVESGMKGLEGEVFGMDVRVLGELEALSEAIKSARSELSTLSPEDFRNEHILAAMDELDAVVRIFEACSFQDITGQRIMKVLRTLKVIEPKIDGVFSAFGDDVARERKKDLDAELDMSSDWWDEQFLHCPQSEGEASSQDDIDKLLASFE